MAAASDARAGPPPIPPISCLTGAAVRGWQSLPVPASLLLPHRTTVWGSRPLAGDPEPQFLNTQPLIVLEPQTFRKENQALPTSHFKNVILAHVLSREKLSPGSVPSALCRVGTECSSHVQWLAWAPEQSKLYSDSRRTHLVRNSQRLHAVNITGVAHSVQPWDTGHRQENKN